MDIHKPKSWHGLREFLKEYLIIVVGVLTALAAEQVVTDVHDAHLANETRATAHAELTQALEQYRSRLSLEPCVDRRLDEIGNLLETAGEPGYVAPHWIGRPQVWGFNSSGWDAATQAGRTALLKDEERARLGQIYGQLHDLVRLEQDEQSAWADLRQLEDQRRLDPQMRAVVRSAFQHARLANWNVRVDIAQALNNARKVGIHFNSVPAMASPSICLPTTTSRAEAVAQVNHFFGDQLGEP